MIKLFNEFIFGDNVSQLYRGEIKNERQMTKAGKLNIIKLVHTIIWVFFNGVIFYLYYAIIKNKIDIWVWICIGLVLLEGIILLIFKRFCPITIIARKYSDSTKDNFDIFLPNWLAKYNKLIYTGLFMISLVILLIKMM